MQHNNPLPIFQRALQSCLLRVRPAFLTDYLKRAAGIRRTVIATQDGHFWIDPVSNFGAALTRRGRYEPEMTKTIKAFLPEGGTFIDLGANEGYFTVIAAAQSGANGRIIAIEPQERLIPVIAENLKLNNASWATVQNIAISDTSETMTIHLAPGTNSGSSGAFRSVSYRLPTQQVTTRTLLQVFNDEHLAHVDLMKIDIEGFEYEAILGSRQLFRERRITTLALELHPSVLAARNKNVDHIVDFLAECGYTMTNDGGNTIWHNRGTIN